MSLKKKVLLFGAQEAAAVLRFAAAAKARGTEVCVIPREGWSLSVQALAEGKAAPAAAPASGAAGEMAVLCGLEREVDALVMLLREAGIKGPAALLTETNRTWTAQRLYLELMRERRQIERS